MVILGVNFHVAITKTPLGYDKDQRRKCIEKLVEKRKTTTLNDTENIMMDELTPFTQRDNLSKELDGTRIPERPPSTLDSVVSTASSWLNSASVGASSLADKYLPGFLYPKISRVPATGSGGLSTTDTISNVVAAPRTPAPAQLQMIVRQVPVEDSSSEEYGSDIEMDDPRTQAPNREGISSQAHVPTPTSPAGSDHDEPVVHRRRGIAEMRSPSPELNSNRGRNDFHDITVTSFTEYEEGDCTGGEARLPPFRIGDCKREYGMSYREMDGIKRDPNSPVQGEESFLVGGVLPPQCSCQEEKYSWQISSDRMKL